MLAASETVAPPATTSFCLDSPREQPRPNHQSLKRHKTLPRPKTGDSAAAVTSRAPPATPTNLGPDPPPTPPTPPPHPRVLSSSSTAVPHNQPSRESNSTAPIITPAPGTPTQQRSPPTPDVTPPQAGRRPKPLRPILTDRQLSKATADSRTESFKTARESPGLSEEEEKTTPRPFPPSVAASQNFTRRPVDSRRKKEQDVGLGLRLGTDDILTPRTQHEFFTFDGEWASTSDVEQEWDDNLNRNVMVRKRPGKPTGNVPSEVIEDTPVKPTNATKAVRSMPLHERAHVQPSPQHFTLEFTSRGSKSRRTTSTSESSASTDLRRSSGMSTQSTVSTVVEAYLVGAPPAMEKKTLRHVRKQPMLRDSIFEISPPSSTSTSVQQVESRPRPRASNKYYPPRTDSMASTGTALSIASRRARRDVEKSGGIPVVVIPDRKGSIKSKLSGPPSLRSTSSHRTKRSNSLGSVPQSNNSRGRELSSLTNQPRRRGRSMSESEGSVHHMDQLTMDYPPIVPRRTSSLSAPTSRNTSRAGSLTTESLKAHNALMEHDTKRQLPPLTVKRAPPPEEATNPPDQKQVHPAPSVESHKNEISNQKPLVDHNGDPFFGKRLTVHNTPFSQASVETSGTHSAADIAEAMAVNIYPHQNKSVLMVHHMSKPVNLANALPFDAPSNATAPAAVAQTEKVSRNPQITASGPDGNPVTPPQPQFSMDDVDSPLRNPRAPPEPPAIKFIPATPSGLTPDAEREVTLGNFFEEMPKQPSLVRRAFSLRKNSDSSIPRVSRFLSRTLSLSRTIRRDTSENPDSVKSKKGNFSQYPSADDEPADESKLHPFWRPANEILQQDDDVDHVYDVPDDSEYRYASVDDRPGLPRRSQSLKERMRRTFSILPLEGDTHFGEPERRTIRRTPSGSLRVVPHRDSVGSSRWSGLFTREDSEDRPSTAPEDFNRRLWGIEKRVDDRGRRIFPGWQDKLGQYKPQNLQRRLSEHRRQKRTDALRQKISGPREVRDGVGEVIKRNSYKGPSYQTGPQVFQPSERRQSSTFRSRIP
ncbi:hypothetical protein F5Y16DRAFT_201601 [Xylariaceae sp. FL0255]|nr:hypothetical protein F5Y16DRAFT_201601 [Xylariaceae sp. FL0255]